MAWLRIFINNFINSFELSFSLLDFFSLVNPKISNKKVIRNVLSIFSLSLEEITNETIELISGMFFGRSEFKSFNNQISK